MGLALATIFPPNLSYGRPFVETKLPHFVWDPVLLRILYAPTFLDLAVLGIVLTFLSRPPLQPEVRRHDPESLTCHRRRP